MAGLFFCLASAEGARLLFCHAAMQPHTSVYSVLCSVHAIISPTPQNSAQGFTVALQWLFLRFAKFYRHKYKTNTSGYNTTCSTLERIAAPQHLQRIPNTTATHGRCTAQRSRPIIIMYIRVQGCAAVMDPCQTG